MVFLTNVEIKGSHDQVIDAYDACDQNGKFNWATPERAALARNVAVRINELTNAISDFAVGTNMSASILELRPWPGECWVEVHDAPEYKDECFGLKIVFCMDSYASGSEVDVAIKRFENRIVVKDGGRPTGWRADCSKHSRTLFKRFGAMKMRDGSYRIKHDTFIAAVPEMIKYFNKSKSLRCKRENNAKLISEIKLGLRKREVKSIQFESILSLAEEWVKGIDPDLNILVSDISPVGSTTKSIWRLHIVNSRPVVWFLNDGDLVTKESHFHHVLTSPLACRTDGMKRYVLPDFRKGRDMYIKAKEWVLDNMQKYGGAFTPEQRDEYIKEAERLPAKLANLYTCDPRFSDDNGHSVWRIESDGYALVSFVVTLDHENDSWLTRYERRELLPRRFQKLLDFGAAVKFENFESVVKYMAHCIHVEDTLWKKADEQWYKLNDAVKEDTATREFFANVLADTGNTRQDALIDHLVDNVKSDLNHYGFCE